MALLDLDRPEAAASHAGDAIARLVVRPIVLAGRNGELADIDLMRAHRDEIDELILWSLHLSVHAVHVHDIEVDWARPATRTVQPLAGTTAGGRVLPSDDYRLCALRADA